MWRVDQTFKTPAPIHRVWEVYTDPGSWPAWTPDIIHGCWTVGTDCRKGSRGEVKFKGLPKGAFEIQAADPPCTFTTVTRFPIGLRIRFDHQLAATAHGTRIEEQISFHGLLAPLVGLIERRRIRRSWPLAMAAMTAMAQAPPQPSTAEVHDRHGRARADAP